MGESKEITQPQVEITTLRVYSDMADRFRQKQRELSAQLKRDLNQSDTIGILIDVADKHGVQVTA